MDHGKNSDQYGKKEAQSRFEGGITWWAKNTP
jgi:hypothetical protein